jgi:hypothetical protein
MKQCPKCNSSCADEDIICKNCGYLFAPAGFGNDVSPQNDGQNNVPPTNDYYDQKTVPPQNFNNVNSPNDYGNQNQMPPQNGYSNQVPPQSGYGNPVPPQSGYGNPTPPQNGYGNSIPPQGGNVPPQYNNAPAQNEWYSYSNVNNNNVVPEPTTNGMSIASLVLGIIGVVFSCCYGFGFVFGVVSLIFGIISKNKINSSEGKQKGSGMSLAGIILAAVSILFSIIVIAFLIANGGEFINYMQNYMNTHDYGSAYDSSSSLF